MPLENSVTYAVGNFTAVTQDPVVIQWAVLNLKSLMLKVNRFIQIPYQDNSLHSTEICPEVGFMHLSQMSVSLGRYHFIALFFRMQLLLVLILCT